MNAMILIANKSTVKVFFHCHKRPERHSLLIQTIKQTFQVICVLTERTNRRYESKSKKIEGVTLTDS